MKIKLLLLMLIVSTQIQTYAQNVAANANKNQESADAPLPATLAVLNQEFIIRANERIKDNEKSVILLKLTQMIKAPEELAFYNEKVVLFENRNLALKNKINDFNYTAGTKTQFIEFKKRWHWAMDELLVYEKNLMTENFLNK